MNKILDPIWQATVQPHLGLWGRGEAFASTAERDDAAVNEEHTAAEIWNHLFLVLNPSQLSLDTPKTKRAGNKVGFKAGFLSPAVFTPLKVIDQTDHLPFAHNSSFRQVVLSYHSLPTVYKAHTLKWTVCSKNNLSIKDEQYFHLFAAWWFHYTLLYAL